jgi:hypothetical protein
MTPPELARMWRISPDKVLAWIHSGELRATNMAARLGGRARYRIDWTDAVEFEERRAVQPPAKTPRRRQKPSGNVIEFF